MLNLDKYNLKFKKDIQQIVDEAYLGLGDTSLLKINNVLLNEAQYDYDDPVVEFLNIMRKPENFHATCRWLFGVDIVPFQNVILRLLWKYKFPMLLGSRGCSKSFMLALYCLIRATLHQGCKIVICGASFRQSKFVFEYMEAIYKKYHVFQSIVGNSKFEGPKRDIDKWTFYIGNSETIACPLGDGSTIRGMRANYIIADEFQSIPRDIFEVVVKGFGAVSESPSERVKHYSKIQALKDEKQQELDKSNEKHIELFNEKKVSISS